MNPHTPHPLTLRGLYCAGTNESTTSSVATQPCGNNDRRVRFSVDSTSTSTRRPHDGAFVNFIKKLPIPSDDTLIYGSNMGGDRVLFTPDRRADVSRPHTATRRVQQSAVPPCYTWQMGYTPPLSWGKFNTVWLSGNVKVRDAPYMECTPHTTHFPSTVAVNAISDPRFKNWVCVTLPGGRRGWVPQ